MGAETTSGKPRGGKDVWQAPVEVQVMNKFLERIDQKNLFKLLQLIDVGNFSAFPSKETPEGRFLLEQLGFLVELELIYAHEPLVDGSNYGITQFGREILAKLSERQKSLRRTAELSVANV